MARGGIGRIPLRREASVAPTLSFGTGGAIGTDGGFAAADVPTASGDTPGVDAPPDVPVGGNGGTGGTIATGGRPSSGGER